jgi:hypothetical protein
MKLQVCRLLQEIPLKDYPIKDIVYLDSDYRTFKYFLTGQYDHRNSLDDQDKVINSAESEVDVELQEDISERVGGNDNFLRKLSNLNEKISLFKDVFYKKKPDTSILAVCRQKA